MGIKVVLFSTRLSFSKGQHFSLDFFSDGMNPILFSQPGIKLSEHFVRSKNLTMSKTPEGKLRLKNDQG